jgi:DNA polymerase I-like protein with 3'-5' exonuclease and polymerase domains
MNNDLVPWFVKHPDPRQIYREGSHVVLDFETDNEDKGSALNENNDIVCACWQVVRGDNVIKKEIKGGVYDMQELLDDIASVDFLMAMNAKFELGWLKRCGMELRDVLVYDPMLAQWALDGNQRLPRSLKGMAKRYNTLNKIDLIGKLFDRGIKTRDIHTKWLIEYCHTDVEACKQVALKQWEELDKQNIWHLAHTRNLTCSVLADIEFEGLILNPEKVQAAYVEALEKFNRLGDELATLSGGINLNSPKQLATFLFDTLGLPVPKDHRGKQLLTPSGAPTANEKALALVKPETEEQKVFLAKYKEYNKVNTLLTKNLEYFKLTVDQRGGKFYGILKQNAVETGRLASGGIPILFEGKKKAKSVQLQNIPRQFKELFWSGDEDWDTLEVDGSQLEFRVAVDMGGPDPVGLAEIENGVDVHAFTAKVLYDNGDPLITSFEKLKDRRQWSKQYTFKPLFGGNKGSPAVEAYCEYFKDKYAELSKTQRNWALTVADKGKFTTAYGMTFHFPGTKISERTGYISNSTNIYNFPIQGFSTGEIIPIAMVYFWHKTRNLQVKLYLTVHDSLISNVHKSDTQEAIRIAKDCMTTDVYEFLERVYHYKFTVPLGLGVKAGKCWADEDAIEYKWDRWPDGREVAR